MLQMDIISHSYSLKYISHCGNSNLLVYVLESSSLSPLVSIRDLHHEMLVIWGKGTSLEENHIC